MVVIIVLYGLTKSNTYPINICCKAQIVKMGRFCRFRALHNLLYKRVY